jgi:hypothetical protein
MGVDALIGLIKSRLGYPTIQINEVTDEQIKDFIRLALLTYVGQVEPYISYYQTGVSAGVSMYRLPDDFIGIAKQPMYVPNAIIEYIKSFTGYQMYVNFTGNLDITHYEAIMEHLQLKLNRLGAIPTYEIVTKEDGTSWLKVYPTPWDSDRNLIYAYVRMPKLEEWTSGRDLIGYKWVQDYSLALTKEAVGRVRSRYGATVGAGDGAITQDGEALIAEARTDIKELEEKLKTLQFNQMSVF